MRAYPARGGSGAMAGASIGSVVSLWRYPVKSMMGEELNASEVTERGLLGDRAYALLDPGTGKVASAKNPKKWGRMFDFRAAFVQPPQSDVPLPPDIDRVLSKALGRDVRFVTS